MQLPPVSVILSWPAPNYVNPSPTRGPELLITTFIFFPIALAMVCLRTFTRLRLSQAFGADDIFLIVATIPTTAIAVITVLAVRSWGWDRHIWDVPLDLVTLGLKMTILTECLFAIAVTCTKVSLLILTRRIMTVGTGIVHQIATVGMAIVACEGLVFALVVTFTCSPVSAYWTLSLKPQNCIDERTHILVGGIINTLTDFFVVLLPLPTVFALQIPRRQQIILTIIFGAGFVVCVAGTCRIYFAYRTTSTYDRTWESYGLWISGVLELYVGIICTALPATKPFFARYLPSLIGASLGPKTPSKNSHSNFESLSNDTPAQSRNFQVRPGSRDSQPSYELPPLPAAKEKAAASSTINPFSRESPELIAGQSVERQASVRTDSRESLFRNGT